MKNPNTTISNREPAFFKNTELKHTVSNLIAYEDASNAVDSILSISYEAINIDRKNMMDLLGVRNTADLIRVAFQKALIRTIYGLHY